jgi:hypothetical protein
MLPQLYVARYQPTANVEASSGCGGGCWNFHTPDMTSGGGGHAGLTKHWLAGFVPISVESLEIRACLFQQFGPVLQPRAAAIGARAIVAAALDMHQNCWKLRSLRSSAPPSPLLMPYDAPSTHWPGPCGLRTMLRGRKGGYKDAKTLVRYTCSVQPPAASHEPVSNPPVYDKYCTHSPPIYTLWSTPIVSRNPALRTPPHMLSSSYDCA